MKTNYDNLHYMSKEELAQFLADSTQYDGTPWCKWFGENYCNKCESIEIPTAEYRKIFGCSSYSKTMICSYCELKGKCKYFPDMDHIPDAEETILLWLESEVDG